MYRLLKITAYQLLLLLIGVPFALILLLALLEGLIDFPIAFAATPFMLLFCMIICFGWHLAATTFLSDKLGQSKDLNLFKIALICLFVYVLMSGLLIFFTDLDVTIYNFFIVIKLLATVGYFYCLAFIAKKLNQIEYKRTLKLSDWIYDMLALFIFPVGIFVIQPRINSLMSQSE